MADTSNPDDESRPRNPLARLTDILAREPDPDALPLDHRLGLTRSVGEQYYRRGLQAYEDGDLENAIIDVSEAIHHDRKYPEYYAARGMFYLENGQQSEAELDLTYALTLNPREWLALYVLATMDYNEGDYEAAIRRFSEALKIAPDRPEILYYRAIAYHQQDDDEKAVADIDRVLQLLPSEDKRRKDATAWMREFKKSMPGPSKPPAANVDKTKTDTGPKKIEPSADRPQLKAGDEE